MRKKKFWNLLTIMMVVMLNCSFASCSDGDDDKSPNPDKPESNQNADLLGWWIEKEVSASSASPNFSCFALHFVDGNVVESSFLVIKKSAYNSEYSTEDVGKYVLTYNSVDYYYSKQNSIRSYAYERDGNSIYLKSSNLYDNFITISSGKLRWVDIEYIKVSDK